ncbi:MAG: winged helix-turn-helix domain-containing protein [Proteobacteria bacterium]|nr:winged helix-turn-helix domain-containing protein [Pseudomonadota bacterium]
MEGKISVWLKDPVLRAPLARILRAQFPHAALAVHESRDGAQADFQSPPVSFAGITDDGYMKGPSNICFVGGEEFPLPLRLGAILDFIAQRIQKSAIVSLSPGGEKIAIGPYEMDVRTGIMMRPAERKKVNLTEKERDIILYLHGKSGAIVDRQELLKVIWGYAESVETHTIETHIYRLRRKIEDDAEDPRIIITEDAGYRLKA